ncbi:MAG: 4Fe-4S dicluster domain-containing protein [Desulfobulbaceae bacterium]|nr:MAG: 4Fe-4S dicluster domain-containing protein [Desulfobulbaceae bacterium]
MGLRFSVDEELCIGCGECASDCPYGVIEMQGDSPRIAGEREGICIGCQHCLAVCGPGALSIHGLHPEDSLPLAGRLPTADQLAVLMQGRRSVRRYTGTPVAAGEIQFLLDTVACAPTGINNRQVLFTVIDDCQVMETLRRATYGSLDAVIREGRLPAGMEFFQAMVEDALKNGKDNIFRGAPHLLIVSAPKDSPSPEADCHIALTYFELLAASMGLGTLWSGLAKWALVMIVPEVLQRLGIPENHQVGYMMVFGYPAVTYHRTVQRASTHVNRVQALAAA